ncbi:MAG: hypothetical protein AAF799_37385 [Myxococcota bacterium]
MAMSMKTPQFCDPPAHPGWTPKGLHPTPEAGARPVNSYSFGRLRPRFSNLGAWHEFWCLVSEDPPPANKPDDLDRLIVQTFGPSSTGELPDAFYLARELLWPLEDVFGIPQLIVAPRSDEEIVELLQTMCDSSARCATPTHAIIRGWMLGFASGLGGELGGLPMVGLVSAACYDVEQQIRPGCADDRARLFKAYQPLLANNGIGDELRAMNFILTQSSGFYELASRLDERSRTPDQESRLVGMHSLVVEAPRAKPLMEVVFSFQNTASGAVRRWSQRVDVGSPFMFLDPEEVLPFYSRPSGSIQPQWSGSIAPQRHDEPNAAVPEESEAGAATVAEAEPEVAAEASPSDASPNDAATAEAAEAPAPSAQSEDTAVPESSAAAETQAAEAPEDPSEPGSTP